MTMIEIAERRNRLDKFSDDEERFRNAVVMAHQRGYSPEEIVALCSRERLAMPVGRILTILEEAVSEEI